MKIIFMRWEDSVVIGLTMGGRCDRVRGLDRRQIIYTRNPPMATEINIKPKPPLSRNQLMKLLHSSERLSIREVESIHVDNQATTLIKDTWPGSTLTECYMIETNNPNEPTTIYVYNTQGNLIGTIYPGPGMSVWYKEKPANQGEQ